MLEKPVLDEQILVDCLWDEYALRLTGLEFLPLGADFSTAVYRGDAADGRTYFIKLRRKPFDDIGVRLPAHLHARGVEQIIAPVRTGRGSYHAGIASFAVIVYPFVTGRDAYSVVLSAQQWAEFGAAMRRIHTLELPAELRERIARERFFPQWGSMVRSYVARAESEQFDEPVAAEAARFLRKQRTITLAMVERTQHLHDLLQQQSLDYVLCHSDIHAGNLLIGEDGRLFIVDWDAPIAAPKERDLMYIGGAQGFAGATSQGEMAMFYRGYGPVEINGIALAYYRCVRILEDIALYCEQLLDSSAGGVDRLQSLHYLKSNFEPGGTIAAADATQA